jgi:hypothetical protein
MAIWADQVRQRLLGVDIDSWDFRVQIGQQRLEEFVALHARIRIHAQDVLAAAHRFGMLVALSPPSAPSKLQNRRGGLIGRRLPLLELAIDMSRHLVRGAERGSARQRHIDLHAAFVEFRQEVGSQFGEPPKADGDDHPREHKQEPGPPHAQTDEMARSPFQTTNKQPVALPMRRLRLRQ